MRIWLLILFSLSLSACGEAPCPTSTSSQNNQTNENTSEQETRVPLDANGCSITSDDNSGCSENFYDPNADCTN